MKRIDIFCASQASTAICMSMDQPSSSSTIQLGGRAIDRHNPIIRDHKRTPRGLSIAPCTSQTPPINPKPYHLLHKNKKVSAPNRAVVEHHEDTKKSSTSTKHLKKKKTPSKPPTTEYHIDAKTSSTTVGVAKDVARKSWADFADFITPPGSSRYLLGDTSTPIFDDFDPVLAQVPAEPNKDQGSITKDVPSASTKPSSSARLDKKPSSQVVVLRVSLHCKGCEGKVRKHLSRMEGVTSFNIDFAAKKVTIEGDVTPLGVLASVSKVKNAQFWTAPTIDTNLTTAAGGSVKK